MNRLEMAEEIAKWVPFLAKQYKDEWKRAEKSRLEFINDYPISKIRTMSLDDYVIGKGAKNRSFCYRLEREMDSLGRILGATASKFGIYYGRTKSDPVKRYRFGRKWGNTEKEAFTSIKEAIVKLLQAANRDDMEAIAKNRLSSMFKGKILFIYYPNQFAPIYSIEHLEYFLAKLDIGGSFYSNASMQRALIEYRATWPELLEQPISLYMRMLYYIFKFPEADELNNESILNSLPLLHDAVKGATFIEQMPFVAKKSDLKAIKSEKANHEKQYRQLKRIGDRGEAIVIALEQKRLSEAGRPDLARQVEHTSEISDKMGYDILSFSEDGTTRYIEVKATSASNLVRGFYISSNELEKAKILSNYYIYFVFSALSKQPQVFPMKNPAFDGSDLCLYPVNYHVTMIT